MGSVNKVKEVQIMIDFEVLNDCNYNMNVLHRMTNFVCLIQYFIMKYIL